MKDLSSLREWFSLSGHRPRPSYPLAGIAAIGVSLFTIEAAFAGIEHQMRPMARPVDLTRVIERPDTDAYVEVSDPSVDELNTGPRTVLESAVATAQNYFNLARQSMESAETQQLRAQLEDVLSQQQAAADAAEKSWQDEIDSLTSHLSAADDGTLALDARMVAQVKARVHNMPARDRVISEARAPFVPQITDLQARLEASISEPSPEADGGSH